MRVDRLALGPLDTNCWVVSDEAGGPAIVIDPAADASRVLETLDGRTVATIVLTHGHFDHLGAVAALAGIGETKVAVHKADAEDATSAVLNGAALFGFSDAAPAADRLLTDGDVVGAGEVALRVLHTPGHTPGGICLVGHGHVFTGDTLFAGSVGRTDLPGGEGRTLRRSILDKLVPLPDETLVHPGHGPDSTIGRERLINPFFPRA